MFVTPGYFVEMTWGPAVHFDLSSTKCNRLQYIIIYPIPDSVIQ